MGVVRVNFKVIDAKSVYQPITPVSGIDKTNNEMSYLNIRKQAEEKKGPVRVKKQECDFKKYFDKEVAKLK